jgi:DNA-binding transcriptional LysR family regulator
MLVTRIQTVAPGVALRFVPEGAEDLAPLRDGLIDLDVGVIDDFGPEVHIEPLIRERLVGLVAPGHPLASGPVTLRRIAAVEHLTVSRRGRSLGVFDEILDQHGLTRNVVAVVPTYTAAAHIIISSQLTGFLTTGYAAQVAALIGAHVYEIPAELPELPLSQAWHVRHDLDPAHQWLRSHIAAALREPEVP